MITVTSELRILILPFLLAAGTSNGFSQSAPIDVSSELDRYRDSLYALETANGYSSVELVETLEQIADHLIALNEHAEAYTVLDRAHQIIKFNEGLFTTSQFRLIRKKIDSLISIGDWRNSRKLQDHLFWLYTHKIPNPDENTVTDLLETSALHIRGMIEDDPDYQSYHRRNAARHSRLAFLVAQAIWPPDDLRQGPVIYEQLKQTHLQAGSNGGRRGTARARRSLVSNDVIRSIYRGNGYLYLEKLRRLYLDRETPDLEAVAMASLYRADWQVLYQQKDLAIESYADAYAELLAAGVPEPLVDELFLEPVLIPEPAFYPTVAEALASREHREQVTLLPMQKGFIRVNFTELSEMASPAGENYTTVSGTIVNPGIALFSFTLVGVEEITRGRWPKRRRSTLGVAYDPKLAETATPIDVQPDTLIIKLGWLHFRPKLVGGIPAAVTGVISYLAVSD